MNNNETVNWAVALDTARTLITFITVFTVAMVLKNLDSWNAVKAFWGPLW